MICHAVTTSTIHEDQRHDNGRSCRPNRVQFQTAGLWLYSPMQSYLSPELINSINILSCYWNSVQDICWFALSNSSITYDSGFHLPYGSVERRWGCMAWSHIPWSLFVEWSVFVSNLGVPLSWWVKVRVHHHMKVVHVWESKRAHIAKLVIVKLAMVVGIGCMSLHSRWRLPWVFDSGVHIVYHKFRM